MFAAGQEVDPLRYVDSHFSKMVERWFVDERVKLMCFSEECLLLASNQRHI